MTRYVGIERDGDGLATAASELDELEAALATLTVGAASSRDRGKMPLPQELSDRGKMPLPREAGDRGKMPLPQDASPQLIRSFGEARNLLLASRLVTRAALNRTESRGAHYRADYPQADEGWRHSQPFSLADLEAA